jgi:hypothetical protein
MLSKIYKLAYLKKYIPKPFSFVLKFIYHFLRYCNIIKIPYSTSKNLNFNNENYYSNNYFLNKLNKCKVYLEYGSGNSTLVADNKKKIIFSVEGDRNFFHHIKKKIKSKKTFLSYYNLGITEYASYPIFFNFFFLFFKKNYINYAKSPLNELDKKKLLPDLILIDGRFRMLCMIFLYIFVKKNFNKFKKKPVIIFDDFFIRNYYKETYKFFHIKKYKNFGVLTKIKNNINNVEYYILKYSSDPR